VSAVAQSATPAEVRDQRSSLDGARDTLQRFLADAAVPRSDGP
jgi:hypothetical protein